MNINKIFTGMAMMALAAGFAACDDISEDDRFIAMDRPEVKRTVLIQEFTGMRCTNCPDGARQVEAIKQVYDVISVNMHPKGPIFTIPLDQFLDLRCEEATAMYQYWRPTGFPAAVINGTAPNTSITSWTNVVGAFAEQSSPLEIKLNVAYDDATRTATADYEAIFNDIYSEDCSIMLWITENGIEGKQDIVGGEIDYVHNHVLRASLNGVWGESIGSAFMYDDTVTGSSSIVLADNWVADNCEIVAFVFNTSSKEVLQVVKASVK